jgi:beta-glucosidase
MREAAVALAMQSDVIVAVLGDNSHSSSEWGDRDNLDLPGDQMALLNALAATGKPIVMVLVTGRTASFGTDNVVLANVSGIFSAFRPGQMGGVAIANLLTGKANPSGCLAQNWVRSAGQAMSGASPWLQWRVGKWVANHRSTPDPDGRVYDPYNDGPATPLFHFGLGLSYTTFAMTGLKVTPMPAGPVVLGIELSVSNTGKVAGTQVVQVYCIDPVTEYVRPWKRLLAFTRVTLAAGTTEAVKIEVSADQMSFQDDSSPAGVWSVVDGEYEIRVGDSSVADLLAANVTVAYSAPAGERHAEL